MTPSRMLLVNEVEKNPALHTKPHTMTIFLEPKIRVNPPAKSAEMDATICKKISNIDVTSSVFSGYRNSLKDG